MLIPEFDPYVHKDHFYIVKPVNYYHCISEVYGSIVGCHRYT